MNQNNTSFHTTRTTRVIFAMKTIRSLADGYWLIAFALYIEHFGFGALGIGLFAALSVVLGIAYTSLFTRLASQYGSRPFLLLSAGLMTASGALFASANAPWQIALAALCGFAPPSGGLFMNALEEGVLAHSPSAKRTKVFADYGFLGTAAGAVGALALGLPVWLGEGAGLSFHIQQIMLWLYTAVSAIPFVLAFFVQDPLVEDASTLHMEVAATRVDVEPARSSASTHGLEQSKAIVYRLAALFMADSMGSGMVATPLLVFWLHHQFGMKPLALADLFFGIEVLAAISFPLAEWISRYIGLLNTAVFTHIPSSVFLMLVPFSPNPATAAALLLVRGLLVEMDVPTRQSYIAAVVLPGERKAAAGVTSIGKQAGRAIGPVVGGAMLSTAGAILPFWLGGAVKIAYDLALWSSFRRVPVRES
ncbi:MAG: MFS transporter [Bacilli bacterium]